MELTRHPTLLKMRAQLFAVMVLALLLSLQPLPSLAQPAQPAQPDSRLFTETGMTVSGKFLDYWNSHGGLAQQGYPISEQMQERSDSDGKTYTVQYFERTVFEMHPENQPPHDVLLSLLGATLYNQKYPNGAPGQVVSSSPGAQLFHETGKTLGGIFLGYWHSHGGIAQQGYPVSEEFIEVSALDHKPYTVQYFQRAVFEYHPENEGTQYVVLLSQLGRFQYEERYSSSLTPTAIPTALPTETAAPTSTPTPTQVPVAPEITAWLREHAAQFNTAEPSDDYSDLMPLKSIIGNARIVSLGEATHGTHEFFAMKDRVLQFLVKEMGFNVFSIEASSPESDLVNNYVQSGQGDPAVLLRGLYFWTWNTQEVLDMIKWMRAHNQSPGGSPTVSFRGLDMQYPYMAMQGVLDYVRKVDSPTVDTIRAQYSCYEPYTQNQSSYAQLPQATKAQCRANLQVVYDSLNSHQPDYTSRSSPAEFSQALHDARLVVQSEDFFSSTDIVYTAAARDRYMAENLAWLLDQAGPGAKVVIWAHNGHVGTAQYVTGADSMGQHLRAQYGDQMRVIGFDFFRGTFNAFSLHGSHTWSLGVHRIDAAPQGSYEYYFHSAGFARMLLDLRGIQFDSPATSWLAGPRGFWIIGTVFDDSLVDDFSKTNVRLPQMFDAVIYFDDTTASHLLP